MSEVLTFAGEHPWLAALMSILFASLAEMAYKVPFRMICILKHGWPPEHCDSDGDLKKTEEV